MDRWEYSTVTWFWDVEGIRCTLPDGRESTTTGSYAQIVELLNDLGRQGWEVAACVAGGNWVYWTLKRPL